MTKEGNRKEGEENGGVNTSITANIPSPASVLPEMEDDFGFYR